MNHHERKLIRHALGLEHGKKKSYRNRYYVPMYKVPEFDLWRGLEKKGLAYSLGSPATGDQVAFRVTLAGAIGVLRVGETLDGEDFIELGWNRRLTLNKN